jgi:hypothetical protein
MSIKFTGTREEIALKQEMFRALVANETKGNHYKITWAGTPTSGWSYGWLQFDLAGGSDIGKTTFDEIIDQAVKNKFIPHDQVKSIKDGAKKSGGRGLTPEHIKLVNKAFDTKDAQKAIDEATDEHLGDLIREAKAIIKKTPENDRAVFQTGLGMAFLVDALNQGFSPVRKREKSGKTPFEEFIAGAEYKGYKKHGDLSFADVIQFYFRHRDALMNKKKAVDPWDPFRRVGNIAAAMGYEPKSFDEAKGVLNAYTNLYLKHENTLLATNGRVQGVNTFRNNVCKPADEEIFRNWPTDLRPVPKKYEDVLVDNRGVITVTGDGKTYSINIPAPSKTARKEISKAPTPEPLPTEKTFLQKTAGMLESMYDTDMNASRAEYESVKGLVDIFGRAVDGGKDWLLKSLGLGKAEGVGLSPAKTSYQQTPSPGEHDNVYQNVSVRELRKTALAGLDAIGARKNVMRGLFSEKGGRALTDEEIEAKAIYGNLTKEEQQAVSLSAELTKEREKLDYKYNNWADTTRFCRFDRFYNKWKADFMKSDRQKELDQLRREIGQKDLDLSKREEANSSDMERILAKIRTSEFQEKKAKTANEIRLNDIERVKGIKALDKEWDSFATDQFCINRLIEKLPDRIGDMGVKIKGAPGDIDNLLKQSEQIAAQTNPAIDMTRQYERGMERS